MVDKSATIDSIVKQLKSGLIKERQEGLTQLRTSFNNARVVQNLDDKGNGIVWLVIFQALFDAFDKEKLACTKKGSLVTAATGPGALALRRLAEIASGVRLLTEQSVQRLNGKVVRPLLAHLLSNLKYQGQLLEAVSFNYIKAIRCILSWAPHLDHLDDQTWLRLVELSFNVILGDPFKTRLEDEEEQDVKEESVAPESSAPEEDAMDVDESASPTKKRRHAESVRPTNRVLITSTKSQDSGPVSQEKVELAYLLSVLLSTPSSPLLSKDYPFLPAAILNRLQRFLVLYPGDSSLTHDYLVALSAVLSRLTLNRRQLVIDFAREAWSGLVRLWGTKNQQLKEDLVAILRMLFPFYTVEEDHDSEYADGIAALWKLLDGEAESRWGINGLSLQSLILQVASDEAALPLSPFVAKTFQHGWQFKADQALAWAILELRADCIEKLFRLSESVHGVAKRGDGKRVKLVNPVTTLLDSVMKKNDPTAKVYHLQALLFTIDRHWSSLHHSLQQDVASTLSQFLSYDEPSIQSWTFMCFASIANASKEGSTSSVSSRIPSSSNDSSSWDSIWTHAMRRSNVPAVCRAACHVAHVLLLHAKSLLSPRRVIAEIETLAKDLDVQGPSFPYDSVCSFLILCMRVASQDVRLYRMQVEEKVLAWLLDAWRPGSTNRSKMPLHSVQDILGLLGAICASGKRVDLLCEMLLPASSIVSAMVEEHSTAVIRQFLLYARLPPFAKPAQARHAALPDAEPTSTAYTPTSGFDLRDLSEPGGRERRISAFFQKKLEDCAQSWEVPQDSRGKPTAERARLFLDFSIMALAFEATLLLNGTRSNRRVIQAACKLLDLIAPTMADPRWTPDERALIVSALDPLILAEPRIGETVPWEAMLPPGEGTGIRKELLRSLTAGSDAPSRCTSALRRDLQRILLQNADVQDIMSALTSTLREVLRLVTGQPLEDNTKSRSGDIDMHDEFGPSRLAKEDGGMLGPGLAKHSGVLCHTVDTCTMALSVLPVLQSSSGESTRDKPLLDILLSDDDDAFLLLAPPYLDNVRLRTLNLNVSSLEMLLNRFESLLRSYNFSHSEELQLLTIHLLHSTLHVWMPESIAGSEIGDNAGALCAWLGKVWNNGKLSSWRSRDYLTRFLDTYLSLDPTSNAWPKDREDANVPSTILPELGADEDIRVRFRAATANARLLHVARILRISPFNLYSAIRAHLCTETDRYEEMLTRLLCLGNVMVVSSEARRGPYWHLLETCLYTSAYISHIETIFSSVAERMGLHNFSELFECYASQIVYSIRHSFQDFLRFPPHLLGYQDRRKCAEVAFPIFTPINILVGDASPDVVAHGRMLYANHCLVVQKTPAQGLKDCFADIVGYQIAFWMQDHPDMDVARSSELEELLTEKARETDEDGHTPLNQLMRRYADGIVTSIVRTLGDQDYSLEGPIVTALAEESASAAEEFGQLTSYRALSEFEPHEVNIPTLPTRVILRALSWFNLHVPVAEDTAVTYHVLHRLFADLERSPLVNEQMRLLNAICLWVARHHEHFDQAVLLRTLLNGAANIMGQCDLARGAQSLLQWVLLRRRIIGKDSQVAEIILRIGCMAHDYSINPAEDVARLGLDLLHWIEAETLELCKSKSLKGYVQKALSAWPRELPTTLQTVVQELPSESLSKILTDERISSYKFRLAKRLHELAAENSYDDEQFSKLDFWRLKECIPPARLISGEDIDSFSELLILQKGRIDGLESESSGAHTVRARHLLASRKESDDPIAPQRAIMASLLSILDDPSTTRSHLAFITLRSLVYIATSDPTGTRSWPLEHRQELELLKAYAYPAASRKHTELRELLSLTSHTELVEDFPRWIRFLATTLSDSLAVNESFYVPLAHILQAETQFPEQALPVLVHTVLLTERLRQQPKDGMTACQILSGYFTSILSSDISSASCRRAIVDTVLHLRQFPPPGTHDPLAHDKWLTVDFLLLSQNAIICGAYTTALLFLELATEYSDLASFDPSTVEQVLYNIYSHIDEPDGFYGIETQNLRQFLMKRFHHEKQWDKAFQFHSAALETREAESSDLDGALQALHSFGFNHMAMTALQGASGIDDALNSSSMTYHLGWRTGTWDLPEQPGFRNAGVPLYIALRAVYRERDSALVDSIVRRMSIQEMGALRSLGNENLTEIREATQNLMCIHQVRRWRDKDIQRDLQSKTMKDSHWEKFVDIDGNMDFPDLETIMACRISLIRSVRQKEQREQIGDMRTPFMRALLDVEAKCLLRLSRAARKAGRPQVALNSVVQAQKLSNKQDFEVSREFAHVLWLTKEPKLALQFLRSLLPAFAHDPDNPASRTRKALLFSLLGTWASEACLEKPDYIKAQYFDVAASLARELDANEGSPNATHASVYHDYAIFAEHQYHAVSRAPDSLRWKVLVDRKQLEVQRRQEDLRKFVSQGPEYLAAKKRWELSKKILEEDKRQYLVYIKTRDSFLEQAINMYSRSLTSSDNFDDDSSIRLCSLWFANFDHAEGKFQTKVGKALRRVASRKFVFLAHQLSARLSKFQTTSPDHTSLKQDNVRILVTRMCGEHPFHTLFPVYCLKSYHPPTQSSTSRRTDPQSVPAERAAAAIEILNILRTDSTCGPRVLAVEQVCDVSLEWAKYPIRTPNKDDTKKPRQIPQHLSILAIKDIQVPVITAHTPIDVTCKYDNCIWIQGYDRMYDTAGGVNLPKISICIGSDGQRYKQLFKGEGDDDLRQDAVMEQVFELVNTVLRRDRDTLKRELRIRCYKVIPLASQAGVLEFVTNTTPLIVWLRKAHAKYRPKDISDDDCRKKMIAQRKKGNADDLKALFIELREQFKPVMRHYFTESHKTPMSWFKMRLNYARSVATTSIVGHILGLGDRHLSNILLDNNNGEVVHIDLGIAFEQGKLLPIPERVPFRLTADMVDGLGTSGTQGVFQRCAEETLRVLRNDSEVILTVLEVFKYDPLHSWTASELKVKRAQSVPDANTALLTGEAFRFVVGIDMSAGMADEAADRALQGVTRKLDKSLSIEFTVNELIAEATDPFNLANMFIGWSPQY